MERPAEPEESPEYDRHPDETCRDVLRTNERTVDRVVEENGCQNREGAHADEALPSSKLEQQILRNDGLDLGQVLAHAPASTTR
jgi:hypothetical protein